MMYSRTKQRGFTLVETLTYGVGLIIILGGIVAFIMNLYGWYRSAMVPTRADQVGIALLTRVLGDVRSANIVNDTSSVFNTSVGAISVTAISGATSTTTRYSLLNGKLYHQMNSSATSTISANDLWISGFYVSKLVTPVSTAVRVQLSVDYVHNGATTTNTYAGMGVLRQSYE